MFRHSCVGVLLLLCGLAMDSSAVVAAQQPPPASGGRTLLLPKQIVSGERATLAVLDGGGRLTPGVSVNFSNGDHVTTDATGRALFVAPLSAGVIYASIGERGGRVYTTILRPAEAAAPSLEISSAPRIASLSDRFDLAGRNFCGEADANQVRVAQQRALVLAASPTSLVVLPPEGLEPGLAAVEITCAKRTAPAFSVTFVGLSLEADSSALTPGEHRTLTVRVQGTPAKVELEARNLAPEIAELGGGKLARMFSSGGKKNTGHFDLVGRQRGSFLISIRLLTTEDRPTP